ncbi:hypothetical protein AB1K54_15185 [Microbacterium sp. BWT-B31]|uniref:hypothetical protein n=1 Tax=Microbacterium sp. BWT-B31 TaxID=3232072 RepID=UPI003529B7E6
MAELFGRILPALVIFGVTALGVAALAWAIHRARRSPRARAAAEAVRQRAGSALVRLDDALDELEIEVGLSGALYGGDAPTSLRRARITAQHVRDAAFEQFHQISTPSALPVDIRHTSTQIERRCDEAMATIDRARTEHRAWMTTNVSAAAQVAAARARRDALRTSMGDTAALVSDLSARFADDEWREASRAARAAGDALHKADAILAEAAAHAADPSRTALPELARAERLLRTAEVESRVLEEQHRLVTQAALAVPGEVESARAALQQAVLIREHLEPVDAERLGAELRAIDGALTAIETDAARHPTRTIDALARVRSRLDLALGDARTAQQRLRGARTALPGTLAAARAAVAQAEASVALSRAGADARSRLLSAQRELASARQSQDPVEALDAARRAMRDAEDAKALVDYAQLGRV